MLLLLKRGYAFFLPNPRGSSGRGQAFAERIVGDIGGADTHDLLSGVDHLTGTGVADRLRLGVIGASYGGYMASWLVTQDARFASGIAVAPSTNLVSKYLASTIPQFVSLFFGDTYTNVTGKFLARSPIMYAEKVKTPMLSICGALDRTSPSLEALQFHRALLMNRSRSVLVTYPEEGHGIRKFPALIDYTARVVSWFEHHLGALPAQGGRKRT
jgi:dipeptidyl aminopeptidase/acylaminoacyl peptidase